MKKNNSYSIAVVGLGYVGLPLALAFARKFEKVVGFDVNLKKIDQLSQTIDPTSEGLEEQIKTSTIQFTSEVCKMSSCNFYIVGVPTPIDDNRNPDLSCLQSASHSIGTVIKKGDIVVFESTVYPGVTEEFCGEIIEKVSGLKSGKDFVLGYSPERINPGDKEHTLEKIIKVVSGQTEEALKVIAEVYGQIITAGLHLAPSIKVAEAAKVIENTQRDLNIALMNELAIIFERMEISTAEVLKAAGTKWNFLKFTPGLVGGHCIGVDPYYLTTKAEQLGYHPQVILAGRRINDDMGKFIAQKTIKLLIKQGKVIHNCKVGILGITFKENVIDLRNSRVPDISSELNEFGITPFMHDPNVNYEDAYKEYKLCLSEFNDLKELDALIFAVPHNYYLERKNQIAEMLKNDAIIIDIKSAFSSKEICSQQQVYWSL